MAGYTSAPGGSCQKELIPRLFSLFPNQFGADTLIALTVGGAQLSTGMKCFVASYSSNFTSETALEEGLSTSQAVCKVTVSVAAFGLSTVLELSLRITSSDGVKQSSAINITCYKPPKLTHLAAQSGTAGAVIRISGDDIPLSLPDPSLVRCRFGANAASAQATLDAAGGIFCQAPLQSIQGTKTVSVSFNGMDQVTRAKDPLKFTYFKLLAAGPNNGLVQTKWSGMFSS